MVEFFLGLRGVWGVRVREWLFHVQPNLTRIISYTIQRYGSKLPAWLAQHGLVYNSSQNLLCKYHLALLRKNWTIILWLNSVKTTMVSLMGLPRVTISVVPMNKIFPNVMDIPFISGFISSAIDTAVAEYVAPKSLTLDLQRLISGDDIKKGMRMHCSHCQRWP